MKHFCNRIKDKCEDALYWLIRILNPVTSIVVVLVFIIAVFASICYIELVTNNIRFLFPFNILNITHLWSDEAITVEYIKEHKTIIREGLEMTVNVFIAVSSLFLFIFTTFSYFQKVAVFNKHSSFKKKRVLEDGKEDIEVMINQFRGADYIAIFSSTFNWINKNDEMKKILTEAAKKRELSLYTKNKNVVINNLKGQNYLLDALHETQIDGLLHLSYVERNNARYIIYRQEVNQTAYVITVRENSESRYLIEIISKLVKATV